jgi:hypothetical protein
MDFARTIIHLCSNFKSYREIRDLPVTSSVRYLLKLVTLLALVLVANSVPWAIEGCNEFVQRFDKNLPMFSLHDGRLTSDAKQPSYWGDTDLLFILDTTGKVTKSDPTALRGFLFMADSFTFWVKPTNTPSATVFSRELKLAGFPDGIVNGDYIRHLIQATLWLALPLLWMLLILVGMLTCLLQAYLFSIAASFLERGMPSPIHLNQLLNIAIHAVTPAAIIVTVYTAMRLKGLDLWLIYLIAYGIFVIGAANACRDKTTAEEPRGDDWL